MDELYSCLSVSFQTKAIEQNLPVVVFDLPYLTFRKGTEQYFPVVLFIML